MSNQCIKNIRGDTSAPQGLNGFLILVIYKEKKMKKFKLTLINYSELVDDTIVLKLIL
jgi:hypothetical protein